MYYSASSKTNSNKHQSREAVRQRAAFLCFVLLRNCCSFRAAFGNKFCKKWLVAIFVAVFGVFLATFLQLGKLRFSVALDILRYADVPSVDVFENELPVGRHRLRCLCFGQVFDDLNAVSGDLVVEQERL